MLLAGVRTDDVLLFMTAIPATVTSCCRVSLCLCLPVMWFLGNVSLLSTCPKVQCPSSWLPGAPHPATVHVRSHRLDRWTVHLPSHGRQPVRCSDRYCLGQPG